MKRQRDDFISQNRVFENDLKRSLNSAYAVSILRNDNSILNLNSLILKQENFLVALKTTLNPNRTFTTSIRGKIDLDNRAITPSRKLIIILGFISGLFFAILLSLFLQFLRDRRE